MLLNVWGSSGLLSEVEMVVHIMLWGSYLVYVSAMVTVVVWDRSAILPGGAIASRPSGAASGVQM